MQDKQNNEIVYEVEAHKKLDNVNKFELIVAYKPKLYNNIFGASFLGENGQDGIELLYSNERTAITISFLKNGVLIFQKVNGKSKIFSNKIKINNIEKGNLIGYVCDDRTRSVACFNNKPAKEKIFSINTNKSFLASSKKNELVIDFLINAEDKKISSNPQIAKKN